MKESYRREQKRRIKELSSALKDPSVIILSSWLKVRMLIFGFCSLCKNTVAAVLKTLTEIIQPTPDSSYFRNMPCFKAFLYNCKLQCVNSDAV